MNNKGFKLKDYILIMASVKVLMILLNVKNAVICCVTGIHEAFTSVCDSLKMYGRKLGLLKGNEGFGVVEIIIILAILIILLLLFRDAVVNLIAYIAGIIRRIRRDYG